MKITRSILLIAFLMLFYRAFGQPAERLIRIQITPNHTDWLYKPGEKIKFSITVLKNNVPIPDTEIRYQISEDMMKPHKEGILQAEKGTATVEAKTMEKPGFLRCQAFVKYGGREYQGIVTVGINPEKLKPITSLPEDFLNFWETAKLQAQKQRSRRRQERNLTSYSAARRLQTLHPDRLERSSQRSLTFR